MSALTWQRTTARFGGRVEYAVTEFGVYVVDGNGCGRMRWTADYVDGDGCMTDTRAEARANCELDYAERVRREWVAAAVAQEEADLLARFDEPLGKRVYTGGVPVSDRPII